MCWKRTRGTITSVEIIHGRSERKADEGVTGGVEEIATMGRIDVEKDARDDDSLLL